MMHILFTFAKKKRNQTKNTDQSLQPRAWVHPPPLSCTFPSSGLATGSLPKLKQFLNDSPDCILLIVLYVYCCDISQCLHKVIIPIHYHAVHNHTTIM